MRSVGWVRGWPAPKACLQRQGLSTNWLTTDLENVARVLARGLPPPRQFVSQAYDPARWPTPSFSKTKHRCIDVSKCVLPTCKAFLPNCALESKQATSSCKLRLSNPGLTNSRARVAHPLEARLHSSGHYCPWETTARQAHFF